jgi:ribonuclease D
MSEVREQMITRPEELAACCEAIAACPVFGFDTEFVGEDSYHPRLCLVQVATPQALYLIDPLTVGPLDAFWQLVVDPARVVVVHAGREEVRLCRLWTGRAPGNLFDLQLGAGLCGLPYPLGHGSLVQQILGVQLAKGETLTEWRDRPLTPAQVRYAFDDVRFLLRLWTKLSEQLERRGRCSWAREEFARMAASTDPEEETSQERWRKLRGLGSLDRRRLAIVKQLHAWREQRAAETNRPSRVILRDDLIVEIARRSPTRARDLQVVRGLPRRDLDVIVEVVQAARALPAEECPEPSGREQEPPRAELVRALLGAVLADHCARLGLAPNLVASNQDLKLLVRARMTGAPLPESSQLTRGWRAQHLLPELLAVLDGQRLVRVADLQAEAPLGYAELTEGKAPA